MAKLRFAILKNIGGKESIVIEYDESEILNRFVDLRREILSNLNSERVKAWQAKNRITRGKVPSPVFSEDEITSAERIAFKKIISDFKAKTVSIV